MVRAQFATSCFLFLLFRLRFFCPCFLYVLCVQQASILTSAATNAMYFGHADFDASDVGNNDINAYTTLISASLMTSLVPMVLLYLFTQHTPRLAHVQKVSLYDVVYDKVASWWIKLKLNSNVNMDDNDVGLNAQHRKIGSSSDVLGTNRQNSIQAGTIHFRKLSYI